MIVPSLRLTLSESEQLREFVMNTNFVEHSMAPSESNTRLRNRASTKFSG